MKLRIDTSEIDTARISIGTMEKVSSSRRLKSQMVLPLIEELLIAQHLTLKDITDIEVVTGPGSFTGLRVGVTVANALGHLLAIPVNGKKALALPTY